MWDGGEHKHTGRCACSAHRTRHVEVFRGRAGGGESGSPPPLPVGGFSPRAETTLRSGAGHLFPSPVQTAPCRAAGCFRQTRNPDKSLLRQPGSRRGEGLPSPGEALIGPGSCRACGGGRCPRVGGGAGIPPCPVPGWQSCGFRRRAFRTVYKLCELGHPLHRSVPEFLLCLSCLSF